jgi:hypothetical protein
MNHTGESALIALTPRHVLLERLARDHPAATVHVRPQLPAPHHAVALGARQAELAAPLIERVREPFLRLLHRFSYTGPGRFPVYLSGA